MIPGVPAGVRTSEHDSTSNAIHTVQCCMIYAFHHDFIPHLNEKEKKCRLSLHIQSSSDVNQIGVALGCSVLDRDARHVFLKVQTKSPPSLLSDTTPPPVSPTGRTAPSPSRTRSALSGALPYRDTVCRDHSQHLGPQPTFRATNGSN